MPALADAYQTGMSDLLECWFAFAVASGYFGNVAKIPQSFRPEYRLTARFLRGLNRTFSRIYHELDVLSPQCLPDKGPGILVCNHASGLDPLLIQSACKRMIIWMMAGEYYDLWPMSMVFHAVDAIPVNRGGRDSSATRAALRALNDGRILGIFPEGRIETTRELLPFQSGVALLAARTQAPVFPAFLDGTQRYKEMVPAFAIPNHASIRFGPPVHLTHEDGEREGVAAATERIREAVQVLGAHTMGLS